MRCLTSLILNITIFWMTSLLYILLSQDGYGQMANLMNNITVYSYTQDYLGNNPAVINSSTGDIEQTIAYYPYGGVIADLVHARKTLIAY